jgi:hypothetical protein
VAVDELCHRPARLGIAQVPLQPPLGTGGHRQKFDSETAASQEVDDCDYDQDLVKLGALAKKVEAQNIDDGSACLDVRKKQNVLNKALPAFVILAADAVVDRWVVDVVSTPNLAVAFVNPQRLSDAS